MKYSEANKKVKKLDSRLSIESGKDGSDCFSSVIYLRHSGRLIAWIYDSENAMTDNKDLFESANTSIHPSYKAIKILIELHETPVEEREDEKNFRVFISNGMNRQRLVRLRSGYIFCDENGVKNYSAASYGVKDIFTKSEVDRLRSNGDFNISWDKALEEVPGDEVSDD